MYRETQYFQTSSKQLLSQADVAIQLTRRTARGEVGHLTIGFTETATHTVLPRLVKEFCNNYPNIELTMLGSPRKHRLLP
ncbi:MAG: LysR family transcriptional regulator [Synechococcales cyanobacterium M58_A2018_015]|nr:LysR family transcriptional regulator [Synechococcales cyanobacterium M58_A2018_015]